MTYKNLPKPSRSNKQVREYVEAAKQGKDSQFVVATGKGWTVRKATSGRASTFDTRAKALQHAQKAARKTNSEVFIYNHNGYLIERRAV